MPSILQSQFTEKGFQKTENVEHNWVSVVFFVLFLLLLLFLWFYLSVKVLYNRGKCAVLEMYSVFHCAIFYRLSTHL